MLFNICILPVQVFQFDQVRGEKNAKNNNKKTR